jgi:raffinose/stachyose/melibiose transport system permease protein
MAVVLTAVVVTIGLIATAIRRRGDSDDRPSRKSARNTTRNTARNTVAQPDPADTASVPTLEVVR